MPKRPKLRTVEKYHPPYPLNELPKGFPLKLGREIVYLLATRSTDRLEGKDWEEIFARALNAEWTPSNVGLDDVVLEQTAWGAKTIKSRNPFNVKRVRLISGRNSPVFSYGDKKVVDRPPAELGEKVLEIYNERVVSVRKKYKHLRTVILIKGPGLLECSVIELPTKTYDPSTYDWTWNKRGNLEGRKKQTGFHRFTWQPHGSQFTIIESLAAERLRIRVKQPAPLSRKAVLEDLQFDKSWVEVVKND